MTVTEQQRHELHEWAKRLGNLFWTVGSIWTALGVALAVVAR